jgi:hypothetical protein
LPSADPFGARASLGPGLPDIYRLRAVEGLTAESRSPITVRILLENLIRHAGGGVVDASDVETLAPGDRALRPRRRSRSCRRG